MIEDTTIAYLAGIIDGEGSIGWTHKQGKHAAGTVQIMVYSTTYPLIEWLLEKCGGSVHEDDRTSSLGTKPCWAWNVSGERAAIVVRAIRPFLLVKSERADSVIANWEKSLGLMKRPGRREHNIRVAREKMLALGWPEHMKEGMS